MGRCMSRGERRKAMNQPDFLRAASSVLARAPSSEHCSCLQIGCGLFDLAGLQWSLRVRNQSGLFFRLDTWQRSKSNCLRLLELHLFGAVGLCLTTMERF